MLNGSQIKPTIAPQWINQIKELANNPNPKPNKTAKQWKKHI